MVSKHVLELWHTSLEKCCQCQVHLSRSRNVGWYFRNLNEFVCWQFSSACPVVEDEILFQEPLVPGLAFTRSHAWLVLRMTFLSCTLLRCELDPVVESFGASPPLLFKSFASHLPRSWLKLQQPAFLILQRVVSTYRRACTKRAVRSRKPVSDLKQCDNLSYAHGVVVANMEGEALLCGSFRSPEDYQPMVV